MKLSDMPDESQKYPTGDIIRILSNLPDFLRESMMRSRLQELCAKDSKTQEEFIDSILEGLSSADKDILKKVIRTWLGVVSRLESSEVSTIFSPSTTWVHIILSISVHSIETDYYKSLRHGCEKHLFFPICIISPYCKYSTIIERGNIRLGRISNSAA